MRYLSVCSGIEAASVAWSDWQPAAFSEIDPFPCAVLAHHYPDVPNWGDMTCYKEWPDAAIDVLVGGTPCQSFSVAGLRKGMADPRGNLALVYLGIADRYRPEWLVWENVPGILSSNGGKDFGSFLGGLGELGYGFAYRVLDAQYFGLAQRRKRVFVVGCARGWQRAAAVLFERASLRGDSAPSREAGEGVADRVGDSLTKCRAGSPDEARGTANLIVNALTERPDRGGGNSEGQRLIPERERALTTSNQRLDWETETFVTHSLRAEGFDASEDGTGRGMPLVPVAFDTTQITSAANRSNPQLGDPCHPITAHGHAPAIAFDARQSDVIQYGNMSGPLDTDGHTVAVAFSCKDHGADAGEIAPTLRSMGHDGSHANGVGQVAIASSMAVRRLTPRECERLQGFPDDYTLIPYRGKPAADGPRYKALGNSMAVPVMAWIGNRIAST